MKAKHNTIDIVYRFEIPDGTTACFDLILDPETLVLMNHTTEKLPRWTRLDFHQCPHCPRAVNKDAHCPVAINLVPLVKRFDRLMSFDSIRANVTEQGRHVSMTAPAQEALSSLMGILIAASDCPHTDFFKPMVRFHQPFASREETLCRAFATYLLSQYLSVEGCGDTVFDLSGLSDIYSNIQILNDCMVNRIQAAASQDSTVNALVHLDVIAKYLAPSMADALDEIHHIFEPLMRCDNDAAPVYDTDES